MNDDLEFWTTVGSAGTLNQADLAKVSLHQSIIQLGGDLTTKGTATAAAAHAGPILSTVQAVVRYNVTAANAVFPTGHFRYKLQLRFRNRVTARFVEVDVATGAETELVLFDIPPKPDFQVGSAGAHADFSQPLDFLRKAYYVEATLTAPQLVVGHPAEISTIQVLFSFPMQ